VIAVSEQPADRQRLDKWLVYARIVKTRSLGQDLARSGHVRINGVKTDDPARPVKSGDTLTIGLNGRVRILKVLEFAERRGPFSLASQLYEDLTPPADAAAAAGSGPSIDHGGGRPTKRDRRRFDRLGDSFDGNE